MKHSRLGLAIGAAALLAAASSCSSAGKVNIGDQQSPTPVKTGLVGSWDGYIEIYKFMDGSDRVRITVNSDGTGTIRFGNEDLLPPATDPNVKYPPNYPVSDSTAFLGGAPWGGFNYTLNGLRVEALRIRGSGRTVEVFSEWCALQTPNPTYPESSVPYSCVPTCSMIVFGSPLPDQQQPLTSDTCYTWDPCPSVYPDDLQPANVAFPCERLGFCQIFCACDANGCALVNRNGQDNISLDASLDDSQQTITGTLVLPGNSSPTNYTVHLNRQ